MASAGTLTLNYDAAQKKFTATVTANPGFMTMGVQLNSPAGAASGMSSGSPGSNPSTWTFAFPPLPGPAPGPDPVMPGTWTATAHLQGVGTATGTTVV